MGTAAAIALLESPAGQALGTLAIEEIVKLAEWLISLTQQPAVTPETVESFLADCKGIVTAIDAEHGSDGWPDSLKAEFARSAIRVKAAEHGLVVPDSAINKQVELTLATLRS